MKYFLICFITLLFCACSHHSSSKNISDTNKIPEFAIHTKDKKVVLAVTDSTVYMQLSKEMLENTNKDLTPDSNVSHDDWSGEFSNFIKTHVRELIDRKLEYNINDIKSVAYKDNGLVFKYYHKHLFSFEKIIDDNQPVLKQFNKKDAEAFIAHFNTVKNGYN